MGNDFAKKNSAKRRRGASRSRQSSPMPGWVYLLLGIAMGCAIAIGAAYYFKIEIPQLPQRSAGPTSTNSSGTGSGQTWPVVNQTHKKDSEEVPSYTFHESLVNKEVTVPDDAVQMPDRPAMRYLMPCGSFRQAESADNLKARIALSGYQSEIVPISTSSGQWYRVQLGPFSSKRKAESIRHRLQDVDIIDCKIWGQKIEQ